MSVHLQWNGLDELRDALRNLPEALAGDASGIVQRAVGDAAQEIRGIYQDHRQTGNLANGVKVESVSSGRFGVGIRLKSTAQHAWLFDNGSQARHYTTTGGADHPTGAMWGKTPPTHAFVRTAIRHRRIMYERLKALLERYGAIVIGRVA